MSLPVRMMTEKDRGAVAELICISTNVWYQTHGRPPIFAKEEDADVFYDTYERLDPGCGLVIENPSTGRLIGSCFYHPRPTHVSLGIMNAHPNHAGKGVARTILHEIIRIAESQKKPLRLVSSAINLDSYSLYNRAGFVPTAVYQDMFIAVPAGGFSHKVPGMEKVRAATAKDLPAIAELDARLTGVRRDPDYAFFLENAQGFWRLCVTVDDRGALTGWMASGGMIGPGVAINEEVALAMLLVQLNHNAGKSPVFLVPVTASKMVAALYAWGAKNCELHFQQVRGAAPKVTGITMPTFLPESA